MKSASLRNYLIVSFCVHFLVMGAFTLAEKIQKTPLKNEDITVTLITPPSEDLSTEKVPVQQVYQPANQVVEQSDQSPDQESPDARFLSAKNQKVQKQTVAKERGEFKNTKKICWCESR